MATGKWKEYDKAGINKFNGVLDLNSTTNWYCALFQSTSNCDTLTSHEILGDLTNEVANGNGYTTGGQALTNVVLSRSGNVTKLTADSPVWAASGGSIVARFAVIYKNATVGGKVKPLFVVSLLDLTPADLIATTGNNLNITIPVGGIWTNTTGNSNT